MKKILFFISLVFILSFDFQKIDFYIHELHQKPEYFIEGNINENNSLQIIDSNIYKIVESQGSIDSIYHKLIDCQCLTGVATYTYRKKNRHYIESVWFEFKSSNNKFYGLTFYFHDTFPINIDKLKNKMSNRQKVEIILSLQSKKSKFEYIFSEISILGFPIPISDPRNNKNGEKDEK